MDFEVLRQEVTGDIVLPGDDGYQQASTTFRAVGAPAVVVRPRDARDVARAVRYAAANALVLSVRGGGHSGQGFGTNTGGLVIDLSAINAVEVLDAGRGLVRIGAGATWGEVATALQGVGLGISSGDTRSVGVGGLTLGGGIGWMVRRFGLTIDSLVGATVVTADGNVLRADDEEHPDLFWALRGGGGNVGVVVTFDFAAKPVGTVVAGTIQFRRDDLPRLLGGWRDVMASAADELTSDFVALPAFGDAPPGASVACCYAGDDRDAAMAAIEPLLRIGEVLEHDIGPKAYADILEEAHPPPGFRIEASNVLVETVSDDLIAAIEAGYGDGRAGMILLRSLGGAMSRVPADATAFAYRDATAVVVTGIFFPGDATDEEVDATLGKTWEPVAAFGCGAYAGFLGTATEQDVRAVFPPATYARLAAIKQVHDPGNLFDQNFNVTPRIEGGGGQAG